MNSHRIYHKNTNTRKKALIKEAKTGREAVRICRVPAIIPSSPAVLCPLFRKDSGSRKMREVKTHTATDKNPEQRRPFKRSSRRWNDNIKCLKMSVGLTGFIRFWLYRYQWWGLVNLGMRGSIKCQKFLVQLYFYLRAQR
jgi:hypothetical protein